MKSVSIPVWNAPICMLPLLSSISSMRMNKRRCLPLPLTASCHGRRQTLSTHSTAPLKGVPKSWTSTHGELSSASCDSKSLQVVLCSPQIPGNTGSIARTCAATAVGLHLVEPLGFIIDDSKLKRAGLDYWPYVVVKVHSSWIEFYNYFLKQEGEKRLLAFTKKGKTLHTDFAYKPGDWLLFGSETSGLSEEILECCKKDPYGGGMIRIPIRETYVRSLNLAVSAGIGIYEALRQIGYYHLDNALEESVRSNDLRFDAE